MRYAVFQGLVRMCQRYAADMLLVAYAMLAEVQFWQKWFAVSACACEHGENAHRGFVFFKREQAFKGEGSYGAQ